jgi:hypothetical protein
LDGRTVLKIYADDKVINDVSSSLKTKGGICGLGGITQ